MLFIQTTMFLSSKTSVALGLTLLVGNCYGFFFFDINQLLISKLDIKNYDPIPEALWITQPLDWHTKDDNRTWEMRYFKNLEYFRPGGPIILLLGGHYEVEPWLIASNRTIMVQLAEELKGALFLSEHRFYGKSAPNNDFSVQNLAYLSSYQAIQDNLGLIKHLKSLTEFSNSKVVVFGFSYAGNLAAWMNNGVRTVDAVWASSAPVLAKTDFYEFYEAIGDAFKKFTTDCYEKVAKKFKRYEELLKTPQGIKQLKKEEDICDQTDMTVHVNQQNFFRVQTFNYILLVQNGSPEDIRKYCPLWKLNENIKTMSDYKCIWNDALQCYGYDYNDMIYFYKNFSSSSPWIYQKCTEFGYIQSFTSVRQPFTQILTPDFFFNLCTGIFGPDFDEERLELGVNRTNNFYGGLKPDAVNVVFINGETDPWHKLGVLEDLSNVAPARVVTNGSHTSDLFPKRRNADVVNFAKNKIKEWIGM